jgi:PAS domain S-box-containing protein
MHRRHLSTGKRRKNIPTDFWECGSKTPFRRINDDIEGWKNPFTFFPETCYQSYINFRIFLSYTGHPFTIAMDAMELLFATQNRCEKKRMTDDRRIIPCTLFAMLFFLILPAGMPSVVISAENYPAVPLTDAERNWLDQHPDKLTLFFNTEFPPIEFISDSGEFIGMGAEIITCIEKRLGVRFIKRSCRDWNAHLAAIESGECAIAPTIVRTAERERYVLFTTPYATVPVVIITARAFSDNLTLDDLQGRRIGAVSGYATEQYVRDRNLDRFEVVSVQNVSQGLRNVAFGQLDALVENLAVAAYTITQEGIPNLRVAGKTDYAFAWRVGVSRHYPLLYSAIQKAMNEIPENELESIRKHWIALEGNHGIDPKTLNMLKLAATFVVALILSLSLITFFLKRKLNENVTGLRKSEQKYRELIENSNSIILRMDAACRITFFNEFAQCFFGFQEADILGRNVIGTIIPPVDSSGRNMVALMQDIVRNPADFASNENENIRNNGERVWIAWTNKPVYDPTGKLVEILCIGNDISALKRAKDENSSLLRFQNEILDTAAVWIDSIDLEGRITFWNRAAGRISGFARDEVIGRNTIWEWLYPDSQKREHILAGMKDVIRNNERMEHVETEIRCKNGPSCTISWHANSLLNENGDVIGRIAIGVDVTERNRHEAERALLSTVIEQAEENVLITDHRRTIIYINPAFERSSGYICEELKGKKLKALRSDQHDEDFYQTTKTILDRGEVWMGVIINRGKNGTNFEIEGTISPIRSHSGEITHYVAVGRNMSRFRRLEKELQQAQKLDALGTLAGGIAHDFNNVLAAIMGLIEMESFEADDGSQTRTRMQQALSACCRARDLIKQILAFSRHSDQQRKPVDMVPIVEDALKMLRASLPATIEIQPFLTAGHSVIVGDATQIHQIIVNLCTNAAHAMRDTGGRIEIRLDNIDIDADQASKFLDMQPGPYVRMIIGDTGHGMDRKTIERIFEPFFTTKGPGEGTGIGLSVVHGIVKSHGGKISVYSEPGKGSTFKIFFPRTDTAVAEIPQSQNGISTGSERILLVDDEEIVIEVVTEILEVLGYEVVSCLRSADALDLFRAQSGRFHLVITDLTMPEITGIELATELMHIRRDIPIILSTGFSSAEIREEASSIGIREVILKPFILSELAGALRRVLDKKLPEQ